MDCTSVVSPASRKLPRGLARFGQSRTGATAVEFAMVALPFLFCVFAIFELAIVFLISITLDNATANAARQIRTGNIQASGGGATSPGALSLEDTICKNLGWLQAQCVKNSTLFVDVRVLNGFDDSTVPPLVVNQQINTSNFCFYSGQASAIVLVRTAFKWPLLTPFLNSGLSRLGNGIAMISSTTAFKSEPFPGAAPSGNSTC
jgi:Flp pilus assembly protein TadG